MKLSFSIYFDFDLFASANVHYFWVSATIAICVQEDITLSAKSRKHYVTLMGGYDFHLRRKVVEILKL